MKPTLALLTALVPVLLLCSAPPSLSAEGLPWWDNYPLLIQNADVAKVHALHADGALTSQFGDPSWGIYAQRVTAIGDVPALMHKAGFKAISYYEAYGETTDFIIELGSRGASGDHTAYRTFWTWGTFEPKGGAIRWTGPQNYFDAEDFCGPYTRLHPLFGAGGRAMTYPDGRAACGYLDDDRSDPRKSRVHDAGSSKDVLGKLWVHYDKSTGVPADRQAGLLTINGDLTGHLSIGKDTACPMWIDQQRSSILSSVKQGQIDGIWADNFSPWDNFGYPPIKGAFGDWSVARFRDHLAARFTASELTALGIKNPTAFDVRSYLREKLTALGGKDSNLDDPKWNDASWLSDPIWRAYKIFKRQIGTEALTQFYDATKEAAARMGKPGFAVLGNDIPFYSLGYVRGNLDLVSSELSPGWHMGTSSRGFMMPPVGRFAPAYKLGREHARSRLMNVWMYLKDGCAPYKEKPGAVNTLYYEMLANHTLPMLHDGHPDTTQDPAINSGFFGFVKASRETFGGRDAVADVGVYYSTSSILASMTPAGFYDMENQPHAGAYNGWATALGNLHYQYRPIPEWKLSPAALARLCVLVIPHAEVLDEADVNNVIKPWVRAGGLLIVTGNSGARKGETGNFNPAAAYSLADLTGVDKDARAPAERLKAAGLGKVCYIKENIGLAYFNASTAAERASLIPKFTDALSQVLRSQQTILAPVSAIPETLGLNLYVDSTTRRLFVDANNYNVDPATDSVTDSPPVTFSVKAPSWLSAARSDEIRVQVLSPTAPPSTAKVTKSGGGRVQVELGPVKHYASIVLSVATSSARPQGKTLP